jgi:hypothetical protein
MRSTHCAKGCVFLQLYGWLGVEELQVRDVSDSHDYMEHTPILKDLHTFAKINLVNGIYLPFKSILDNGYCIIQICWREGQQQCIPPSFARSDKKFNVNEMLISVTLAADGSGTERAVRASKIAGMLKRGLQPNGCPQRLNNTWSA